MNRSSRRHALPLSVLVVVAGLDILLGRDQQVLSLTVIAPLVAASVLGRRATAGYGVLAVLVAALLGVYDLQYTAEAAPSQVVRLFGIALGGALAVAACTLRLRGEEQLRRVSAQAAASRAVVQLAETLQRNLLGDPPVVAGLETAVRYRPATRHAQVGGDWYDAFPAPDGTTMLVIGDVAGHDAPAAATMSQTRGMLRAIAQSVVGSPATLLTAAGHGLRQSRDVDARDGDGRDPGRPATTAGRRSAGRTPAIRPRSWCARTAPSSCSSAAPTGCSASAWTSTSPRESAMTTR